MLNPARTSRQKRTSRRTNTSSGPRWPVRTRFSMLTAPASLAPVAVYVRFVIAFRHVLRGGSEHDASRDSASGGLRPNTTPRTGILTGRPPSRVRKWRNWQTRKPQELVPHKGVGVRIPPSAPILNWGEYHLTKWVICRSAPPPRKIESPSCPKGCRFPPCADTFFRLPDAGLQQDRRWFGSLRLAERGRSRS